MENNKGYWLLIVIVNYGILIGVFNKIPVISKVYC